MGSVRRKPQFFHTCIFGGIHFMYHRRGDVGIGGAVNEEHRGLYAMQVFLWTDIGE